MKKIVFYFVFSFFISFSGFTQEDISSFISSGSEDMENLTKAYLEPFGKGFGAAMNSGWYWTAKTHETLGFDFTVNTTLVTVPTEDTEFSFGDYTWNTLRPGSSLTSPTLAGSGDGAAVGLELEDGTTINNLYQLPEGAGFDRVPLPMMQLGVGIIKGTDITFRFFPELEFGDYGKIGMIGFGLKHDIKQWIPGIKKLPFDMALQGGWSRLSAIYSKIDYYPTDFIGSTMVDFTESTLPQYGSTNFDNAVETDFYRTQDMTLTTTAWNANFIISKKMSVFTAFASLGYSSSNLNIGLNGRYLIPEYRIPSAQYPDQNGDYVSTVLLEENVVTDPIDADIDYSSVSAAVGFQLKLAIVSLHAAYIYQSYSMVNFGLGISFR